MSPNSVQSFSEYLAQFPQSLNSIDGQFSPLSGGFSGAGVYRYHSETGCHVLRRWPVQNGLPTVRILGLHQLLEHLRASGVETAVVPQQNRLGSTLSTIRNRQFQVEPFVDGVADFRENPSTARLRNTMNALANWHLAAASFKPTPQISQWFRSTVGVSPAIKERLQLLQRFLSGGKAGIENALPQQMQRVWLEIDDLKKAVGIILNAFDRLTPQLASDMEQAATWTVPLQPCLRDIWHDHVLFNGDEVAGIIDPSATRTESVATDLARLLGSFLANDWGRWEEAIGFYSKVRPLADDEQRLIPILDRSGLLLSGMRWLEKLFLEKPTQQPSVNVIIRVQEIAGRLEEF